MTENLRRFLEAVSKNDEMYGKFSGATKEDMLAMAKELGVELTAEDLEQKAEMSDDELEAVAGGKACYCAMGGGGEAGGKWDNKVCACVLGGGGEAADGNCRCVCTFGGWGAD